MFCRAIAAWFLLTLVSTPLFATDGTFQGQIISPPATQAISRGWIYVQGANHMLRRVDVSHADIVLSANADASQKRKCSLECLSPGQEIRITAEQDRNGEWRAKRVEILKLAANKL